MLDNFRKSTRKNHVGERFLINATDIKIILLTDGRPPAV
jgi:hypothetical protein